MYRVSRKYTANILSRACKKRRIMIIYLVIRTSIASGLKHFAQTWNTYQEFLLACFRPEFLLTSYRRPFYNARSIWLNKRACIVSRKYTANIFLGFVKVSNNYKIAGNSSEHRIRFETFRPKHEISTKYSSPLALDRLLPTKDESR